MCCVNTHDIFALQLSYTISHTRYVIDACFTRLCLLLSFLRHYTIAKYRGRVKSFVWFMGFFVQNASEYIDEVMIALLKLSSIRKYTVIKYKHKIYIELQNLFGKGSVEGRIAYVFAIVIGNVEKNSGKGYFIMNKESICAIIL